VAIEQAPRQLHLRQQGMNIVLTCTRCAPKVRACTESCAHICLFSWCVLQQRLSLPSLLSVWTRSGLHAWTSQTHYCRAASVMRCAVLSWAASCCAACLSRLCTGLYAMQ
jgi:hypothetical protein